MFLLHLIMNFEIILVYFFFKFSLSLNLLPFSVIFYLGKFVVAFVYLDSEEIEWELTNAIRYEYNTYRSRKKKKKTHGEKQSWTKLHNKLAQSNRIHSIKSILLLSHFTSLLQYKWSKNTTQNTWILNNEKLHELLFFVFSKYKQFN